MALLQAAGRTNPRDAEPPPRCPECGYVLLGLPSRTCPECGFEFGNDLDAYRGYQPPRTWQRGQPFRPLRGIFAVLRHPVRTLAVCDNPQRVTLARAAISAGLVSIALVVTWPVIREGGQFVACGVLRWRDPAFWSSVFSDAFLGTLLDPRTWLRLCHWELWSIARWWLMFGALAISLGALGGGMSRTSQRSVIATVLCRLLLFAPWVALLEIGYLLGVWIDEPQVVPEPSTFFALDWTHWAVWPQRSWLIRGILPSAIVGYLFFRAVLGWRRATAIVWAIIFIPIAIYASIAWSILYMDLFLR